MKRVGPLMLVLAAAVAAAACTEVPQEAGKVYAGKEDQKPYASDKFKGDKAQWEKTLAARANSQNEYARSGSANY